MERPLPQQDDNQRPLVTFTLFAYNQEKYIREAVEGAFSQTYSPLEIILSDDCSTDRTFEIIEEMAAAYRGSHRVVLNRMDTNSGLSNHINHVFGLANGELLILAAGDDISLPRRASVLVDNWIRKDKQPSVIYSNIDIIDSDSRVQRRGGHVDHSNKNLADFLTSPFALICSYSVSKALTQEFPLLNADLVNEDFIFALRSLLKKRPILYVNNALVLYRVGVGIGSTPQKPSRASKKYFVIAYEREGALWRQICSDLRSVGALPAQVAHAQARLKLAEAKRRFCTGSFAQSVITWVLMKDAFMKKIAFLLRMYFPRFSDALGRIKIVGP